MIVEEGNCMMDGDGSGVEERGGAVHDIPAKGTIPCLVFSMEQRNQKKALSCCLRLA